MSAERVETRWRDVQWIGFGSEPDDDVPPAPSPLERQEPAKPGDTARGAPQLGSALRRFAKTTLTAAPAPEGDAIRGLVPRFARLRVQRLASADSPATFPPSPETTPSRANRTADPGRSAFPASIYTHVLEGLRPAVPEIRAFAKAWRGARRRRGSAPRKAPMRLKPPAAAALFQRPIDRISRSIAARERKLRVSGLAALCVVGVALAAYVGGAVIARVAQPSSTPASPPANSVARNRPATADDGVGKQLALADKIIRPSSSAPEAEAPAVPPQASDPVARAKFYIVRAKASDPAAQYDVGVLYSQGQGLVQDYASAANWFRAAARQGNLDAEYDLGVLYAEGLGGPANPTEAINWYRSAADQNHAGAQFNLALAYATGSGTRQDYAAAARWYQRAAARGVVPAMINLAILYEAGNGVGRSPVDAYAWYSAAGERGDAAGKARATALFQQFNDKDKARAEGLAATIGAALDSFNGATSGPANGSGPPA